MKPLTLVFQPYRLWCPKRRVSLEVALTPRSRVRLVGSANCRQHHRVSRITRRHCWAVVRRARANEVLARSHSCCLVAMADPKEEFLSGAQRSDSAIVTALFEHFFGKRARSKIFEPQALSLRFLVVLRLRAFSVFEKKKR